MAYGQQHQHRTAVGHGVQIGRGKGRDPVDGTERKSHLHEPGSNQGQANDLAGRAAADQERQQRDHDPADDDGVRIQTGQEVKHHLEGIRSGDDGTKTSDRADAQGHGNGIAGGGGEDLFNRSLGLQRLPEQHDGEDVHDQQAGDDIQLCKIEQHEQDQDRNQGDPKIRTFHIGRELGIQRMTLKMLAVPFGAVDKQAHQAQDADDLNHHTHNAGNERHVGLGSQRGHGCNIAHLGSPGHGLNERIAAGG